MKPPAAALIALSLVASAPLSAQKKSQAVPPKTQPFGSEAFQPSKNTTIRWLGNAGFFINSRGTTLMVDPLLQGFDMPLLFDMPVAPQNVPRLDAVLITHRDNDHYSVPTCRALARVSTTYHSTQLVASLMKKRRAARNRAQHRRRVQRGTGTHQADSGRSQLQAGFKERG